MWDSMFSTIRRVCSVPSGWPVVPSHHAWTVALLTMWAKRTPRPSGRQRGGVSPEQVFPVMCSGPKDREGLSLLGRRCELSLTHKDAIWAQQWAVSSARWGRGAGGAGARQGTGCEPGQTPRVPGQDTAPVQPASVRRAGPVLWPHNTSWGWTWKQSPDLSMLRWGPLWNIFVIRS